MTWSGRSCFASRRACTRSMTGARVANWAFRVARNAVIDEYRRAARDRERLMPAPTELPAEEPMPGDEDPAPGRWRSSRSACARCSVGLPPDQRRAVELIDLDGWSQSPRRAQRGRLAVGDEVPRPARATSAGEPARGVLCAHPRRAWSSRWTTQLSGAAATAPGTGSGDRLPPGHRAPLSISCSRCCPRCPGLRSWSRTPRWPRCAGVVTRRGAVSGRRRRRAERRGLGPGHRRHATHELVSGSKSRP